MSTKGIACPACGGTKSNAYKTQPIAGGIRRCRRCLNCGVRFVTGEAFVRTIYHGPLFRGRPCRATG